MVQQIYAAVGRGDISAILDALADDVNWLLPGPADIPVTGKFHGRKQVAQFSATVAETVEIEQFVPQEFIAQGDKVVVLWFEWMVLM